MKLRIRDEIYYDKGKKLLEHVREVVDSYSMPITSRQVFYRLVAKGCLENTHPEYRKACRICSKGRYTGHIDWDAIVDDTRGAYKTQDWNSMEDAVKAQIEDFRLDRWANSSYYLEVYVEKRGMVNTLYPTTDSLDVHIVSCGGWDSTSNVWGAARRLIEKQKQGKAIRILYFGDFDPSGDFMHNVVERKLREFDLDLNLDRILLKLEQVQLHSLPVKFEVLAKKGDGQVYDKLKADPRAKGFKDKYGELMQVEIDALEPNLLIEYVKNSILEYLDTNDYRDILKQEKKTKKKWRKLRIR